MLPMYSEHQMSSFPGVRFSPFFSFVHSFILKHVLSPVSCMRFQELMIISTELSHRASGESIVLALVL